MTLPSLNCLSEGVTLCMARRINDPTSARYMRDCIRHAIRSIRLYRKQLDLRAADCRKH
jgi:hypothetical protein